MIRARLRLAVIALAVAVAAAPACTGGSDDPVTRLAAAFEATAADSVAYRLTVTADAAALGALGDGGPAAAAFLSSFAVSGSRTADGSSLAVQLFDADLLDVRSFPGERTFVQFALSRLPGVPPGLSDPEALLPALRQLNLGDEAEPALAALLRGGWMRIDGPLDVARFAGDDEQAATEPNGASATFDEMMRRYVTVESVTSADGKDTYRVAVAFRDLLEAMARAGGLENRTSLAAVPRMLPGSVLVDDGVVARVRLDLAALTAGSSSADGQVELQLDLSNHGRARAPEEPDAEAAAAGDVFVDAIAMVLRFATGTGLG